MRTSKKQFQKQLAEIERRRARLRRIRQQLLSSTADVSENVAVPISDSYAIGMTQNSPENIPRFLERNAGDPAVQVRSHFPRNLTLVLILFYFCYDRTSYRAFASTSYPEFWNVYVRNAQHSPLPYPMLKKSTRCTFLFATTECTRTRFSRSIIPPTTCDEIKMF